MGFSFDKCLTELEIYQTYEGETYFLRSYGDWKKTREYMEINIEDENVLIVMLGMLLEKMELRTPILDAKMDKAGVPVEKFLA